MGHYYSEMACSDCGFIPCKCARIPDMTHIMWLVDPATLDVMQVGQFDRKYAYVTNASGLTFPGNPHSRRFGSELFTAKKDAEAHRVIVIDQQITWAREKMQKQSALITVLLEQRRRILDES